jgi:hypothetical protein
MTRPSQKIVEKCHVESFFRSLCSGSGGGIAVENRDWPEPDILVRGDRLSQFAGPAVEAIYVEHTTYRTATALGLERFERSKVDFWHNELLPVIDAARRENPAMRGIAARLHFKEPRLPVRPEHQSFAADLIHATELVIPRFLPGRSLEVSFQPRKIVAKCPPYAGNMTFLSVEDSPVAAKHLNLFRLESYRDWEWPPWWCPQMMGGWSTPSASEFRHILTDKREKEKKYNTNGKPLWLLIVAELANDL